MNLERAIDQCQGFVTRRAFDLDAHRIFRRHGDFPRWQAAFDQLPPATPSHLDFGDIVTVGLPVDLEPQLVPPVAASREHADERFGTQGAAGLRSGLAQLRPWRKGPFAFFGVAVDAEWRSDWKWRCVTTHVSDLAGRHVLDVGCGNGYYGWRMLEAGAADVIGCDPTLNSVVQHLAVSGYVGGPAAERNLVLPLRFEDLPDSFRRFDTVFSMGVLYHHRNPQAHVAELYERVRPGGELVVESLVAPGGAPLVPCGRYAGMRNVYVIPDEDTLVGWLRQAGLADARIVDVTVTTVDEQRTTEWMPFRSLASALDPGSQGRTIEGHPAPTRAIAIARRPR